jgi:N-acetylglucosamine-6-sulfatase
MGNGAIKGPLLGVTCLVLVSTLGGTTPASAEDSTPPPNIVLVLTDDMGADLIDAMPQTHSLLADQGVTFTNGIAPTSICCPARAALLTGTYSHTNGVWSNGGELGGWPVFSPWESSTVATALDAAGYRTGLFGKYLNQWAEPDDPQVPPGWDTFVAMRGPNRGAGSYYNYDLIGTEPVESYGTAPEHYSTDVIAAKAADFIASTPSDQPLFAVVAPYAPHSPFISAPRHAGTWPGAPVPPPANEADLTDKPAFMQALPLLSVKKLRITQRRQHESLIAVDEAVQQLIDSLGVERADNTLFIFTSDNSLLNGDHRMTGKYSPYAGASEIPVILRWDTQIPAGELSTQVFTLQDITATIADAAGVTMQTEGVSWFDAVRPGTVVEGITFNRDGIVRPPYCGWRTDRYLYVRHSSGAGEELYDYEADPAELQNAVTNTEYADVLEQMRGAAEPACTPGPPGYSWHSDPPPAG